MSAASVLEIVQILSAITDLALKAGIDVQSFIDLKAKAKAEGRDISDEEIDALSLQARESIGSLKGQE